ncbi:esterase-like activity of phytase family protein [Paenibacillus tarimensis]
MIAASTAAVLLVAAQISAASASKPDSGYVKGKPGQEHAIGKLTFLGEQRIPNDEIFKGTLVGGLSGIDYNPVTDQWIMISDDRSDKSPARFYTAKLEIDTNRISNVMLTDMIELKQPDGTTFPNKSEYTAAHKGIVPDLESIRFDPNNGSIRYTSEGDRNLGLNPFIFQAAMTGDYMTSFDIPEAFQIDPIGDNGIQKGFRNNLALEGSSFSPDGKFYFTSMEGSLYQDGAISTVGNGSYSRITKYNRNGEIVAEYAYPVDAIPAMPGPGKNADNGVTELLALNGHRLLVLERAGVQAADGSYSNYIRIYEADTRQATNVKNLDSLQAGPFKPVSKKLVLNLNALGLPRLDNIEGMTWGPELDNGHGSLVLLSDNNFNSSQVTQLLAFDVAPEAD